MTPWVEVGMFIVALISVGITAFIQYSGRSEWQGKVGARLDGHDQDIEDSKEDSRQQWTEIGLQGKAIARLEGQK